MTVKELKQKLEKFPDNMDVCMEQLHTEFHYGEIENVKKRKINYKETPEGKTLATDYAVVLSDEI